ncbi:2833_t:CDS:1, partial [Racocetra fulgida]
KILQDCEVEPLYLFVPLCSTLITKPLDDPKPKINSSIDEN